MLQVHLGRMVAGTHTGMMYEKAIPMNGLNASSLRLRHHMHRFTSYDRSQLTN